MDANHVDSTPPKKRPRHLDPPSDGVAQPTLESYLLLESELRTILRRIESDVHRELRKLKNITGKINVRQPTMDANHADFTPPKKPRCLLDPTSDGVVQPTLESLLIVELHARKKLKEKESEVHWYRGQLEQITDGINCCQADRLTPVNNKKKLLVEELPVELLTMIFGFLAPDDMATVYSVCQWWRSASMFAAELWSNIIVSEDNDAIVDKAELYWTMSSSRSSSRPLRVSYTESIGRWQGWRALTIHHDERQWKYRSACGSTCGYKCRSIMRRSIAFAITLEDCRSAAHLIPAIDGFTSLQELSVSIRRQNQESEHKGQFEFSRFIPAKTPSLRSLTISAHILPRTSLLFDQLTQLHVTDTFYLLERPMMNSTEPILGQHILGVLRSCRNLEDFSFDGEMSSEDVLRHLEPADHRLHVRLPKLRRLRLICHYSVAFTVLPAIAAPNVEDVVLNIFPRDRFEEDEPSTTAGKFVARCPKIRALWLYGLNHKALFGTPYGLQQLERLHLEHVPGLDIIANSLRSPNQLDIYTDLFWFIPRLSTLSIVENLWDVPFESFAKVIKERYPNQQSPNVPARIQEYVVNDQNLLAADGQPVADYSQQPHSFPVES